MLGRYYRPNQNWVNQLWNYIHSITIIHFDDSNVNKKCGLDIYECLKTLKLPCKHCQKELDEEINNIDIDKLNELMYLFKWSWNLHNAIDLLTSNQDKINWDNLSKNNNAIELLSSNQDKINWDNLSYNTNAIELYHQIKIKLIGFHYQ